MIKLSGASGILLLASLIAIGPLALDMYLPALPAIAAALGASSADVQLSLSLYMAGFAVAQLFYGPVSDRFGRKPAMLAGMGLFSLAGVVCALAPNIESLLAARFLQALGGAAGPVLARAAVRDAFEPREGARALSYMASVMAIVPAVAPLLGGLMLGRFGWTTIFYFLAAYGGAMVAVIAIAMPESLPADRRQPLRPGVILGNYRHLLGQRGFLTHSLTNALAWSGLFAFLSAAPFVLIEFMGVPPERFGLYFALVVAGFFLGNLAGGRLSRRLGAERLILAGASLTLLGGASMAVLALAEVYHPLAVAGPHAVYLAGTGLLMPQTTVSALTPFPRFAGAASSLFGCIQLAIGVSVGTLVGQIADPTSRTLALTLAATGLAALLSGLLARRAEAQEPGWERPSEAGADG